MNERERGRKITKKSKSTDEDLAEVAAKGTTICWQVTLTDCHPKTVETITTRFNDWMHVRTNQVTKNSVTVINKNPLAAVFIFNTRNKT